MNASPTNPIMIDIIPPETTDNSKDTNNFSHNKKKANISLEAICTKNNKITNDIQVNNFENDDTMIMFNNVKMINPILRMIEHGAKVTFKNNNYTTPYYLRIHG